MGDTIKPHPFLYLLKWDQILEMCYIHTHHQYYSYEQDTDSTTLYTDLCWGGGIPSFSSTLSLILSTYNNNTTWLIYYHSITLSLYYYFISWFNVYINLYNYKHSNGSDGSVIITIDSYNNSHFLLTSFPVNVYTKREHTDRSITIIMRETNIHTLTFINIFEWLLQIL